LIAGTEENKNYRLQPILDNAAQFQISTKKENEVYEMLVDIRTKVRCIEEDGNIQKQISGNKRSDSEGK
jgi:hypothetical protein